jgi:hypothetical protein
MMQNRSDDENIQQFATWVNEQNDVISKIEIGKEARPTERPTEVKNCERNNNKTCPICRLGDHKPKQCDKFRRADRKSRWKFSEITGSVCLAC